MTRARAVFGFWRWVVACLLLTFAAPAPASAQVEDTIFLVAGAREERRAPDAGQANAAGEASPPSMPRKAAPAHAPPSAGRAATRLYLVNCALLR